MAVGVLGTSLGTLSHGTGLQLEVGGAAVAVFALEAEVLATRSDELSVIGLAASDISGQGSRVQLVTALLAAGASTGASERVSGEEGLRVDGGLVVVVAVETFLSAWLILSAVASGHSSTGAHAGLKGKLAINLEVGSAVTLVAGHLEVLRLRLANHIHVHALIDIVVTHLASGANEELTMSSRTFRRAQLSLRNLGLFRRRVSEEGVVHARDGSLGKEAVTIQLAVGVEPSPAA